MMGWYDKIMIFRPAQIRKIFARDWTILIDTSRAEGTIEMFAGAHCELSLSESGWILWRMRSSARSDTDM